MLNRIVFIALMPAMLIACGQQSNPLGLKSSSPKAMDNHQCPSEDDGQVAEAEAVEVEEINPVTPEEARQALEDMGIPYSQSSFIEYAAEGNLEVVQLFVWAGMSVNVQPYTARTVLVSTRENPTALDHLESSWFPQEGEEDNDTALMKAAYGGHLEVVKFLLSNWADMHIKNQQEQNVITFAAAGGHLDVVKFLMEDWYGPCEEICVDATALLRGNGGNLDLDAAYKTCRSTCSAPLRDATSYTWDALVDGPLTHVQWAAYNGHLDVLQYMLPTLIRKGVPFLNTILDAAALGGHVDVVQWLVDEATTSRVNSSLMVASYLGHVDIVRILLNAGANIGWRRSSWIGLNTPEGRLYFEEIGFGALHAAIQTGHSDVLRILLEHWMTKFGADGRDEYGMTVLHFASAGGDIDMVKISIKNGAPVNGQSDLGTTALHFAAQWGHIDIVKNLLSEGADTSLVNALGETALILAEENGHTDIVNLLQ